uniref:PREDICTED: similar to Tigger transposable elementderived protein 6 putative n=1 Tax=Albugo laibachii Nc14 TaxID=890382 RepID=F0WFG5_9STRA|nr:PREDICTED: similar to Tigger transposable elementderived protein 6 putative [Albugo laibachii Nc14]|eukprot:CCA19947.1 PREDICTED: similar to Tigger transposable elementderived protein 6 putative [Albugo laibachii Nc14]
MDFYITRRGALYFWTKPSSGIARGRFVREQITTKLHQKTAEMNVSQKYVTKETNGYRKHGPGDVNVSRPRRSLRQEPKFSEKARISDSYTTNRFKCLKCGSQEHSVRNCPSCTMGEAERLVKQRYSDKKMMSDPKTTVRKAIAQGQNGDVMATVDGILNVKILFDSGADCRIISVGLVNKLATGKFLRMKALKKPNRVDTVGNSPLWITRSVLQVSIPYMKQPLRMRVRLTIDQQRTLVQHNANNDTLTLQELGLWAKKRFALPRAPSVSKLSQLLKRFRAHPELLQPCNDANVPASKISLLLDAQLLVWIEECGQRGICITGHLIRLKAERLRDELVTGSVSVAMRSRLLELTFSEDWLYNFQRHHIFKSRRTQGEAGSACATPVEKGRVALRARIVDYEGKDVYDPDETALYYCKPPNKTICTEPISGRKSDKKRLTVAVVANADGTEKLPLLFVGSAVKPHCFGRQSGEHHGEWLNELNERMKKEGRQIMLLLDNASAHCTEKLLSNVEIEMLPPNTTSVLQPMDAGVIACLKAYFHRRQGCHDVDVADSFIDNKEKITKDIYKNRNNSFLLIQLDSYLTRRGALNFWTKPSSGIARGRFVRGQITTKLHHHY